MAMVYEWQGGSHNAAVDPQKAGEAIERLVQKHGAAPSPVIVNEARKKRSVLHEWFTWDDAVAGEMYRHQEATRLVRTLVKVQERPEGAVRRPAFFHVSYVETDEQGKERRISGYQGVDQVVHNQAAKDSANAYLLAQLEGLERRQRHLVDPELFDAVWRSIEMVRERLAEGEEARAA